MNIKKFVILPGSNIKTKKKIDTTSYQMRLR